MNYKRKCVRTHVQYSFQILVFHSLFMSQNKRLELSFLVMLIKGKDEDYSFFPAFKVIELTLYCLNFFRSFSGHSLT